MGRRLTMVLALALPMAITTLVASAQPAAPKGAAAAQSPAPKSPAAPAVSVSAHVAPTAVIVPGGSASASVSATVPGVAAAGSAAAPAPAAPAGSVAVDMTTKPPSEQGVSGATYAVRLRDLEQRVDELKDQIRRSHTRLALLSDTILGGGAAGSRSEVEFKNEMSSAFQLIRCLFVIDGQVQYNRQDDTGALADQKEIPIYTGSVPPGDHTIQVALTFQGNGYGVFSYLRGYKFDVKSSHAFTAVEGKAITVAATAFEKGGVTTPLEQRPAIEWQEKLLPLTAAPVKSTQASGANVTGGASLKAGATVTGAPK